MGKGAERDLGKALIDLGWDQGKLVPLPIASYAFYRLGDDGTWHLEIEPVPEPSQQLIVVSQACDIVAPSERFVEAMPCAWYPKDSNHYNGTRAGNSARYFRLRKDTNGQGQDGAIIVDATRRVQVAKASLLNVSPLPPVIDPDRAASFSRRFGAWLGGRYSRPALDSVVVTEVQQPIVKSVGALRPDDELYDIHDLIREVRMFPIAGAPPSLSTCSYCLRMTYRPMMSAWPVSSVSWRWPSRARLGEAG